MVMRPPSYATASRALSFVTSRADGHLHLRQLSQGYLPKHRVVPMGVPPARVLPRDEKVRFIAPSHSARSAPAHVLGLSACARLRQDVTAGAPARACAGVRSSS